MAKRVVRLTVIFLTVNAIIFFGLGCRKPAPTMTLSQAIQTDNTAQVEVNLKAGADVNAKDDMGMPLVMLAAGRSNEVLKAVLDHKPSVNVADDRTGLTALHAAAMKYDGSANVRLLLAAGADSHLRDKRGRTPLYLAAESGDLESVKALLDAGADVNAPASDGLTPLDTAEQHRDTAKDPNVGEYLKGKGATNEPPAKPAAPASMPVSR